MPINKDIIFMTLLGRFKGPCFGASDTNGPPPAKPPPENIAFANALVDELRGSPLEPKQKYEGE